MFSSVFWCFIAYSFIGYCLEKIYAAATHALQQNRKGFLLLPLCPVYGLAMGLAAWAVYGLGARFLGDGRLETAVAMVLAIGAAVIVYFVLVVLLRAITYEDMKLIPKGEKLARILHIK